MVRGVSDLADQKKDSAEVKAWRKYACDIAAVYTIALLQSGPVPFGKKKIEKTSPSCNDLQTRTPRLANKRLFGSDYLQTRPPSDSH
jgi:hypothetical protein